jgi:hypothetical protein
MSRRRLFVNEKVRREIEGIPFIATIERLTQTVADIRYMDDGNIELNVPIQELHQISENDDPEIIPDTPRKGSLPKPLLGLVEDDSESRKAKQPTILIHREDAEDEVIVLNGAENRLAAGGGLRALRYLK